MITKEELVNTYIKHSSDITEEIFDKIIDKLEGLGFKKYSNNSRKKEYDFFRNGFSQLSIDNKHWFVISLNEIYKEIQVSDVLENNQFILPKKWCVKSTNNTVKALNDFIKSKGYGTTLSYNYYIHYPFLNGTGSVYNSIQHGYTEITFDQFKQHVLKESVEEIKSIEKWFVGSYIVPLQDRLLSRTNFLTKGKPYEITKLILGHIPYIIDNDGSEINFKTDFKDAEAMQGIKWFPTLAEAEAFSKSLLEPKPLTIDNLVEGEIYKAHHIYLFRAINKQGGYNLCLNISSKNPTLFRRNKENVPWLKIELPIYEERKWFIVCEKQDKIVPKEDLSKYDSEGNLIQVKPTFEFNKWYKSNNADGLFFIQSKNTGYGFRSNHVNYWFTNNGEYEWNLEGIVLATNEEVEERLISYAKENYSKNDNYRCLFHKDLCSIRLDDLQITEKLDGVVDSDIGYIFYNGQWAEVISKPETKESKEMQLSDLKNPVFNIGDKVKVIADSLQEFNSSWSDGNNARYKKGYEGLITGIEKTKSSGFKEVNTWYYLDDNSLNAISCNLLELVEPVKKEFDRNVYYEVSNQEQYEEILNWLESKGENVYTGSNVTKDWKYIYKDNFWCLYNIKPNLPKANFTFKNKQKCTFNEGIVIKKEEKPIIEKKLISKVKKSIEF